jgi:hypothetical protein
MKTGFFNAKTQRRKDAKKLIGGKLMVDRLGISPTINHQLSQLATALPFASALKWRSYENVP